MEKNKQGQIPPRMEQKIVKFEIGKLLAVVITVVVIAGVASVFLSSNFYKGMIGAYEIRTEEEATITEPSQIEMDTENTATTIEPSQIEMDTENTTATIVTKEEINPDLAEGENATTTELEPIDYDSEEATITTYEKIDYDTENTATVTTKEIDKN